MRHQADERASGAFCVFDINGRQILRRDFRANIFNCDLSTDGRFAVCQTANSSDPDDSSTLAVFDVVGGKEIARWQPTSGRANFYQFSADGKTIGLGYHKLGVFSYSVTGKFIDQEMWQDAYLNKGDYSTVILMTETLIKKAGSAFYSGLSLRLLSSLDRVAPKLMKVDSKWQALAFKIRGLCLEVHATPQEALGAYEKALTLNPKVGVKRRADQLRKAIAQSDKSP